MSNEFTARFARVMGCTVNLITGREFNDAGRSSANGESCADCGGCSRQYGEVGLVEQGVKLMNSVASGLELLWNCPGCGRETWEDTTLLSASAQARATLADPLCVTCRNKSAAN